jgi:hypothetical protein
MGINKREYEKTLPVLQVKQFERELNTFMMFKEKSSNVDYRNGGYDTKTNRSSSSTACKSKSDSIQPQSSKI